MSIVYNVVGTAVLAAVVVGAVLHRRRRLHVRIMTVCFAVDMLLLLVIEVTRGAVEGLLGLRPPAADLNRTMLAVHVPFAVATLVLWFLQIGTGRRILKGDQTPYRRHRIQAFVFLGARVGNAVTAWMLYS